MTFSSKPFLAINEGVNVILKLANWWQLLAEVKIKFYPTMVPVWKYGPSGR
jgi:hypothetical protein